MSFTDYLLEKEKPAHDAKNEWRDLRGFSQLSSELNLGKR